jgi:hypothetical protein
MNGDNKITENGQDKPWYSALFQGEKLCLLLGTVFFLCSLGTLKVGEYFKFNPSENISGLAQYAMFTIGTILIFFGLTILAINYQVFSKNLGRIFFALSVVSILTVGGYAVWTKPIVREELIKRERWGVRSNGFYVVVRATQEAQLINTGKKLFMVCRRANDEIDFENDVEIEKSLLRKIKDKNKIVHKFERSFIDNLKPGDFIQCRLYIVSENLNRDKIMTVSDLDRYDAKQVGPEFREDITKCTPSI